MYTYSDKRRKQDAHFFSSNRDALYKKYGAGYIAIRDKKVLGIYRTIDSALKSLTKKYPLGTFVVQKCSADAGDSKESIQSFFAIESI